MSGKCMHGVEIYNPCNQCIAESEIHRLAKLYAGREVESLRSQLSSSEKEVSRLKGEVKEWRSLFTTNIMQVHMEALKAENEDLRGALERIHGDRSLVGNQFKVFEIVANALARAPDSFAAESKALQSLKKECEDYVQVHLDSGDIWFIDALADLKRARDGKP